MADSYSTFLQVRLPATGAYNNTWGSTLNSDALSLLDVAIAGWTTVGIGGATTYSLPALTAGSASTSRYFSIMFTGTPPSTVVVTVPGSVTGKMYLIDNQTGQPMTFTYGGAGGTATVANGEARLLWCDGSNVVSIVASASDASTLDGTPAANWMRQSRTAAEIAASTVILNACTIPTSFPFVAVTEGPTTTLDCHNGNSQILTLTGNRVMGVPSNARDGQPVYLAVLQDGTGNRTLSWNAVFLFENGISPVLGTAPGALDILEMRYNAALNKWLVAHFANLNPGSGATQAIVISQNCLDWNLAAVVGTLGSPATINIVVSPGVIVEASCAGTPAMDLSGIISGSTINLTNNGYIIGKGGDGGDGAEADYPGSGVTIRAANAAKPGGNSIKGPGSGVTFNVTNGSGHIWGGGGGGGGSGASDGGGAGNGLGNGGGGGGGAGGGKGGRGGRCVYILGGSSIAGDGNDATTGPNGTLGTAGTGTNYGAGTIGTAGAGGDFGAAGATGTNPGSMPTGHSGPFSAGGAAGKAIELSGGAATFVSGSGSPNVKGSVS